MPSDLHVELIQARRQALTAGAREAAHRHELARVTARRDRSRRTGAAQRLTTGAVVVGVVVAMGALTGSASAGVGTSQVRADHTVRALEREGWVGALCTDHGTRLRDPRSGRTVVISWTAK